VPRKPQARVRQKAAAGRDAYLAGRDQVIVDIGAVGVVQPVVPGLLPRDAPGFTGRDEELATLAGLADGTSVVVTAIGGTAGVGKTALAVHAAHKLLAQFPDGQLYADLRGYTAGQDPAGPGEVLAVFLRCLGVPAEDVPVEIEERSGLLRQLLASRRMLMVLDNARTEAQVRPLLPGAGGSLVLITSRSVLPGLETDARISLDVLTEDRAAVMLAALTGVARSAAEPDAVAQVTALCGRLPLALRIAGQLLASHPTWPVARLVQLLADEQYRLARLGAGDLQVRAAFEVSYRLLADEEARLFRRLGLHPGPDFTVAAAAALVGIEEAAAGPVLDRLTEAYLVTEATPGRFGMHDLLRLFARGTCQQADSQADRDAAETRLVGHYADLAEFVDSCVDPRLRPAAEQEAEQARRPLPSMREALAIFQDERRNLLAALGLAAQRGWDEQVEQLSEDMADPLTVLHYLDDLLIVMEAALAAARRTGDTAAEGSALGNLGLAYRKLRRFEEAITCYQQELAIYEETGDRYGEGAALNRLGAAYQQMRRFEKAATCSQQALAILRETGDRYGEGMTLNNLGEAYRELGRLEEAIDCYQQGMAICQETADRYGEGQALNNLGNAYHAIRRFEEAVTCYQQALAICRETGARHDESQTLINLGNAYQELGRLEEAITCYQESLVILRETGDRHGEGQALTNLGEAYRVMRRFKEAITCCQESLVILRETGDRHGRGQTLTNLGAVHMALRQRDQADVCWREALAILRETGDRHGEDQTLTNLGVLNQKMRRYEEAITYYQQSLVIKQETYDRHGEGQILTNLGIAYLGLRQRDQAGVCWREAAAAMHDVDDHESARRVERLAAITRRRWPALSRRSSS
jgi:tetratricopeptide (TPR) repeat protein